MALLWPSQLLSRALIQRATTHAIPAVLTSIAVQNRRSAYILSVLNSTKADRDAIRAQAATGAETSAGKAQLCILLTVFEMLSAEKKAAFIEAYRACSTLAGRGMAETAEQGTYQPGHVPPHYVP